MGTIDSFIGGVCSPTTAFDEAKTNLSILLALAASITLNVPTELYNYEEPDEYRLPFDSDEIDYDWDIKMG